MYKAALPCYSARIRINMIKQVLGTSSTVVAGLALVTGVHVTLYLRQNDNPGFSSELHPGG